MYSANGQFPSPETTCDGIPKSILSPLPRAISIFHERLFFFLAEMKERANKENFRGGEENKRMEHRYAHLRGENQQFDLERAWAKIKQNLRKGV